MAPQLIPYRQLDKLKLDHPEIIIEDQTNLAIDELFDIEFPSKKDSKTAAEVTQYAQKIIGGRLDEWGQWVYYAWLNKLVHFPPKEQLRALRTSRNRNLVTAEEQKRLYDSTILVVGMSVGSNVVEALVSQGIGQKLILVDLDIIEPSNLNRIRSPYHHVGLHKVEAISRKTWEIDPYIEIIRYSDGLNENTLNEILANYEIEVVVDEMDELRMKILLREAAKVHKLPVVMAADDGDNALIDIERYDTTPYNEPFNGLIPMDVIERIKSEKLDRVELGMMIGRYFVGPENIPLRMYQSLMEVGKTLPSWPQLGSAAALSGIAVAYAVKKILLGHKIRAGRNLISLDEKLDLEHLEAAHQAELRFFQDKIKGI
jgi:hypothetical protein